ncbi:unnamed protein product [Gongylonema pulchrum]|uniref:CWH43-like N-terminal domain-containing protein n=1 Tax=Gongylonema pulchrum TaxID=637853 RepID=A0A3P7MG34_9BILA|nr:unnamed protein product [Gongylonema pulchrum]
MISSSCCAVIPQIFFKVVKYSDKFGDFQACFSVSSATATYFFSSFPLIALCCCVFLALYNDFDKATETHCGVRNVLPSISVAIGDFHWGRLIWKSLIFAHLPPRVLAAFAYAQLFRVPLENIVQTYFRYLTCFLNLLELFCLGLLSAVSSKDDHYRHVLAFSTFQIAGMIHGALHVVLYHITGISDFNVHSRKSYRVKKICYKLSILFLAICMLLYHRHNTYCEPYVFSMFAFFEYLIVLTNILFHATFRFDFYGLRLFVF